MIEDIDVELLRAVFFSLPQSRRLAVAFVAMPLAQRESFATIAEAVATLSAPQPIISTDGLLPTGRHCP